MLNRPIMIIPSHFDDVTLLVTHYNRPHTLERLLRTFRSLQCSFNEVIVADDGSREENLNRIKALQQEFKFRLLTSPKNMGLGNNINKGQDAVRTSYTLFMTDDNIPQPIFAEHFRDALTALKERDDIDIARFYAHFKYPYLKPFGKGFSEIICKLWYANYLKIYSYSDHPHLRRSNFFQKFGRYAENTKPDKTEYRMCIAFIQKKGKALIYDDYQALFEQKNYIDEPSTVQRSKWTQHPNVFITFLRNTYRQVKYNFDILFLR